MRNEPVFFVFIVILFALANISLGDESIQARTFQKSTSASFKNTNHQEQSQKSTIKIQSAEMHKFTFRTITKEELEILIDRIRSKYDAFSSYSGGLRSRFSDYNYQLSVCSKKAYTYEEQQAAGCQPNDTIQQCSEKLMKQCAGQRASMLKDRSDNMQDKIKDLIDALDELSRKLKMLSSELQQKYQ